MALMQDAAPGGLAKAVFLDKDGTVVENVPYNVDPALVRFTPYAIDGLQLLAEEGFRLVMITNQPGVGLGLFDEAALTRLQVALTERLAGHGVTLDGFYACTHAPGLSASRPPCACRKPAPGLLLDAARELRLDLDRSWMVGDILDDIEAGRRAGCKTVMLDVGNETVWRSGEHRVPHHRATNLLEAAQAIVKAERLSHPTFLPRDTLAHEPQQPRH
ncbi:D-glycero-alpha-D-manno-heptose-1,7-bisphosphate 7-phosphatase [Caldimonas brevitalea]|uniref:D,D-heptose 1,7-bisphosphate phosphatase n=1 Tax=Caldimonas brevitalea TaxID=413882 RepID=A0A0G3BVP9_9BURK|nr:HAD family hydrolase [Caldimonas brevitalea]AKJ30605.1 D-glycero-D-manno-heptose 1,7-bisphosphate phosphatase [Caldimonas brevitalea]